FPDKPDYAKDLSTTYAQQARLFQERRSYANGQKAFDEAVRLQDELQAKYPEEPYYRRWGAFYRFRRADLLEEAGKREEAEKGYRDALDRQEQLVKDSPNNLEAPSDLAATATSLAFLLAETDPLAARRYLERARQAWRQAVKVAPTVPSYAARLG